VIEKPDASLSGDFLQSPTNIFLETSQESSVSKPEIKNIWKFPRKSTIYRAELKHCDPACNIQTDCEGIISVIFSKKQKGKKKSICHGCKQRIAVNISVLKTELGII